MENSTQRFDRFLKGRDGQQVLADLKAASRTPVGIAAVAFMAYAVAVRLVTPKGGGLAPASERGGGMVPVDELTQDEQEKYGLTDDG